MKKSNNDYTKILDFHSKTFFVTCFYFELFFFVIFSSLKKQFLFIKNDIYSNLNIGCLPDIAPGQLKKTLFHF